ncbi:hypothetical protein ACWECR_38575 [Streptomyces sp. NPDC005056]
MVIPSGAPQEVVDALVAHLSAADLAMVAELLLDRLVDDHSRSVVQGAAAV